MLVLVSSKALKSRNSRLAQRAKTPLFTTHFGWHFWGESSPRNLKLEVVGGAVGEGETTPLGRLAVSRWAPFVSLATPN